jgi:hypothetical protein
MGAMPTAKYEYDYFYDFVRQTHPVVCPVIPINFLQLQILVNDLYNLVLSKSHDKDEIKWKCGDILAILFSLCDDIATVEPCQDASYYKRSPGKVIDPIDKVKEIIKSNKEMILYFIRSTMCYWDTSYFEMLQKSVYEFVLRLWELSETDSMHDLMSLKIQMFCHYHIKNEKLTQSLAKPFMQYQYENNPIYPWKYYWNPNSAKLLEFINTINTIELGVEYHIDSLVAALFTAIRYKILDSQVDKNVLLQELSVLLNCSVDDIDLDDKNTLLWPLLFHVYTKSYEELWMSKHRFPRTPMTIRRSAVLAASNVPPLTINIPPAGEQIPPTQPPSPSGPSSSIAAFRDPRGRPATPYSDFKSDVNDFYEAMDNED